jgi:YgiT-type zinc finger domain-containing protein
MKMQLTIKTCPNCGSDQIAKICRDWRGKYKGEQYTVPMLEFYECPVCSERVFEPAALRQIREYSPAYTKRQKATRKVHTVETVLA